MHVILYQKCWRIINIIYLLGKKFVRGETLHLTKISRSEMGAYLCIASNGVPPTISKRIVVNVHCK